MVLRSLRNAFVSQKIESRHFFTDAPSLLMKNFLQNFYHDPAPLCSRQREITHPTRHCFFELPPAEKGGMKLCISWISCSPSCGKDLEIFTSMLSAFFWNFRSTKLSSSQSSLIQIASASFVLKNRFVQICHSST